MSSLAVKSASITSASQLDPRKILGVLGGEWLQQSKPAAVPFSIEAQPTDICNFACQYCSYAFRRENSGFASWDLETGLRFAEFVREEPVRTLCFSGGGEPLIWKHMPAVLERFVGISRLKKVLVTNGALIGESISPELLQDFSLLLVSIASTESGVYRQTMRGDAIKPDVHEHVLDLPTLFRESGPPLNACVVVGNANCHNLDRVAIDLVERGFDFVYFKAQHNYEPSGGKLSQEQRDRIRRAKFRLPAFVAERTNLLTFIQDCREKETRRGNQRAECVNLQHKLSVIITATGDIYTCSPRVGDPVYSLGNVRTSRSMHPLKEPFLDSQQLRKIHEEYRAGQCGRCRFKKYNDLVLEAERVGVPASVGRNYKHPYFI